ncbi:MAG TPA: FecR domain-containing protein [Caulobacter sp.]|nr:FecR domain-containing protein [Caulobacter sp.]
MTFLRPWLAAALLLSLAGCSEPAKTPPPAAPPDPPIGVNAEVENDVQMRSVQDRAWRPAAVQGQVRYADDISTAVESRLVVALQDSSSLTVGPNARLTIDRFVIDTTTGAPGAAVSVTRGAFRFASKSRGKDPVSFRTPVATIGVRGTVLEGVVGPDALGVIPSGPAMLILSNDPAQATLIVLREGIIEIRVGDKVVVLDQPGQALAIGGGGRIHGPFRMPDAAGRRLDALLAPRAKRSPPPTEPLVRPPPDGPRTPGPRTPGRPDPQPEPRTDPPPEEPPPGRPGLSRPQLNRPQLSSPGGGRYEPPPPERSQTYVPPPRRTTGERGPGTPSLQVPLPSAPPPKTQPQTKTQPPADQPDPAPQKPLTTR